MRDIAFAFREIEKCRNLKSDYLDLTGCNLGNIPDDALYLNVKTLILRGNKLIDISNIVDFENLENLDISNCGLHDIPDIIFSLRGLRVLNISFNPIEKISNKISLMTSLVGLILNHTLIDDLPNGIKNLQKLEVIELKNCKFIEFPNIILSLAHLRTILLDNNYISELNIYNDQINRNNPISHISLNGNRLKDFPNSLFYMRNLKRISLSSNKIVQIPDNIEDLENLSFIEIDYNSIEKIPIGINNLKYLTKANFSNNKVKIVPIEIIQKERLKYLELKSNPIQFPPYEIAKQGKTKLEEWLFNHQSDIGSALFRTHLYSNKNRFQLDLSNRFLNYTGFPKEIEDVRDLKNLNISNNDLEAFPIEITRLNNLITLDASENRIKQLPPELDNLKSLELLDLSYNEIQEFSSQITELSNLKKIDLRHNRIEELPNEFKNLKELESIFLEGNPIITPPIEIVIQGVNAIRSYFESIKNPEDTDFLYEAKLILVGNGRVGKTSLRKKLKDRSYIFDENEISTEGLEVVEWELPISVSDKTIHFKFNVWDFGGQGRYRSIQQFFCSTKSLYVFVTQPYDEQINENDPYTGFNYWLSFVTSYGFEKSTNQKSPVIAVVNKIDIDGRKITKKDLKRNFDNIKDFIETSCKTGEGIDDLEIAIKKHILTLDLYNYNKRLIVNFNKKWIEVKKHLEKLKETREIIDYDEYLKICNYYGMNNEDAEYWIEYLHLVGNVLRFKDIELLDNKIILDPNWARKIAYKALDSQIIVDNNGWFDRKDLNRIWDDRSEKYQNISLLKAFDLCYEIGRGQTSRYFIPLRFPEKAPDFEWDESNNVIYECMFEPFIPAGLLSKIIVARNQYIFIEKGKRMHWLSGAIFELVNDQFEESYRTLAWIEEVWKSNKLVIKVRGFDAFSLLLLLSATIKEVIQNIREQKFLYLLKYKEFIFSNDRKYKFDYNKLLNEFQAGGFDREKRLENNITITVGELLTGFTVTDAISDYILGSGNKPLEKIKFDIANPKLISKMKSVFISYSRKDIKIAERIRRHLLQAEINVFMDKYEINQGESIHDFIEKSIHKTDYTILIVSKESLQSAWVAKEFRITLQKALGSEKIKLLPCHIDISFMDKDFVTNIYERIITDKKTLEEEISKRLKMGVNIRDLQSELTLRNDFLNSLDSIIDILRNSYSLDFSNDENYSVNLGKMLKMILNE